jgi:hypothetical protein
VIVAERRLAATGQSGLTEVAVRLYRPEPDDTAWLCRCEIGWPDGTWSSAAAGVDAVQALIPAPQKIGIELYTSPYTEPGPSSGTSTVADMDFQLLATCVTCSSATIGTCEFGTLRADMRPRVPRLNE